MDPGSRWASLSESYRELARGDGVRELEDMSEGDEVIDPYADPRGMDACEYSVGAPAAHELRVFPRVAIVDEPSPESLRLGRIGAAGMARSQGSVSGLYSPFGSQC